VKTPLLLLLSAALALGVAAAEPPPAERGFVTLSLGSDPATFYPDKDSTRLQPLSFHAYEAANCYNLLANLPQVDPKRVGIFEYFLKHGKALEGPKGR
jgi:hypothetical protein